jgi:hypothetical protein
MNKILFYLTIFLLFCFIPPHAHAQCQDPLCQNIQTILDAALIDFREYRQTKAVGPDVSIEGVKVPCQMSAWVNNVPMYICYAQVSAADSQKWFARTLQALQSLNPSWHFQIISPGIDHSVEAGPPDCETPPDDGPYINQCPLHLRVVQQPDTTVKIYLLMNSLTSPYLLHRPPSPLPKTPLPPTAGNGCDEFCQNLKKAFEARESSFEEIRGTSDPAIKLSGAKQCVINGATEIHSSTLGTQYVCYWREASAAAANARFQDLVSRLQVLIPSSWTTHQGNELDDSTGADMTVWIAAEPGNKYDVRVYLFSDSVGLHMSAWK